MVRAAPVAVSTANVSEKAVLSSPTQATSPATRLARTAAAASSRTRH